MLNRLANFIRNIYIFKLRRPWAVIGKNVHCQLNTRIVCPNKILRMGDNVGIGPYSVIHSDVIIGNDVLIAAHVGLLSRDAHTTHHLGVTMFCSPRGDTSPVVIEDDVWIGFGAIILSGVVVGRGSIVAAGAIVADDVPPYSIVASPKASIIGQRFTEDEIVEHERRIGLAKSLHGDQAGCDGSKKRGCSKGHDNG